MRATLSRNGRKTTTRVARIRRSTTRHRRPLPPNSPQQAITLRSVMAPRAGLLLTPPERAYSCRDSNPRWGILQWQVIGYLGGGVQPANRMKKGLFDDAAPIWSFKTSLSATECPETSRKAETGLFIIEVFPALALPGLNDAFHGRLKAPKYNPVNKKGPPNRKKFRTEDWLAVLETIKVFGETAPIEGVSVWAQEMQQLSSPTKGDQDCVDAVICALTGYHWRTSSRENSILIGDLDHGYMIVPTHKMLTERIKAAAEAVSYTHLTLPTIL